jgi:hypothetical protein
MYFIYPQIMNWTVLAGLAAAEPQLHTKEMGAWAGTEKRNKKKVVLDQTQCKTPKQKISNDWRLQPPLSFVPLHSTSTTARLVVGCPCR